MTKVYHGTVKGHIKGDTFSGHFSTKREWAKDWAVSYAEKGGESVIVVSDLQRVRPYVTGIMAAKKGTYEADVGVMATPWPLDALLDPEHWEYVIEVKDLPWKDLWIEVPEESGFAEMKQRKVHSRADKSVTVRAHTRRRNG